MDCLVCDKTNKKKSKRRHLQSVSHFRVESWIQTIYTLEGPDFLEIYKI